MKTLNLKHAIAFILIIAILLTIFHNVFQILSGEKKDFVPFLLLNLLPCLLITLVDFLIVSLISRYFKWNNMYLRVTLDLLFTSIFPVLVVIGGNLLFMHFFPSNNDSDFEYLKSAVFITLWNSTVVLLIEIFFYSRRQLEAEKQMAIFEKEKAQYQYEMLKAQINPHFLFNSLNVLSSLAYKDAAKTNLFAKKLSTIYRYVLLSHSRQTVPVEEELAFLESYIFLEKIRFDNALLVDIHKNTGLQQQVIPVSLQLLVENATKHNIASADRPLHIRVDITGDGITVTNNLQLRNTVAKNGYGLRFLQNQYEIYGLKIEIIRTSDEFIVKMPFVS